MTEKELKALEAVKTELGCDDDIGHFACRISPRGTVTRDQMVEIVRRTVDKGLAILLITSDIEGVRFVIEAADADGNRFTTDKPFDYRTDVGKTFQGKFKEFVSDKVAEVLDQFSMMDDGTVTIPPEKVKAIKNKMRWFAKVLSCKSVDRWNPVTVTLRA